MTNFAQLMFGLVLGARYERTFFARYRLFIPFALLNSLFIVIASGAAAAVLAWAFDLPIATMILATSPGGLAEMHDYRASIADQCAIGGRFPLVPSRSGKHGHPIYLRLRCKTVWREDRRLGGGPSSTFKVECSRPETSSLLDSGPAA